MNKMKIVHIESGLGNQMLSYCEYLALKKSNPEDDIYLETIIYNIPECNEVICQWQGYELDRIFGIEEKNIQQLFQMGEWNNVIQRIRETEFWNKNWNYPVYFTKVLNEFGLNLVNIRGDFEEKKFAMKYSGKKKIRSVIVDNYCGQFVKRRIREMNSKKIISKNTQIDKLYYSGKDNVFTGQRLAFKELGNHIERIEPLIRESFKFPQISDQKNSDMLRFIKENNAVAIHARRGDMLGYNLYCYKYGYFKRAVNFIKRSIKNPTFIFFCDPGSTEWCKKNSSVFNLDFSKDKVLFVDWNKGLESYIDMQLMAECKHQIITNSSFGWWGAFLNRNKQKITISPDILINTTHHF